jgi:hypothetical protein
MNWRIGSISDKCHEAFLELVEVLKNWKPPKEEPVQEMNAGLELLKESMEERQRNKESTERVLAGIFEFIKQVGDVTIYSKMAVHPMATKPDTGKKFKHCVTYDPDTATISLNDGYYSLQFCGMTFNDGNTYITRYRVKITEKQAIEAIIDWLIERKAQLPKVKENV